MKRRGLVDHNQKSVKTTISISKANKYDTAYPFFTIFFRTYLRDRFFDFRSKIHRLPAIKYCIFAVGLFFEKRKKKYNIFVAQIAKFFTGLCIKSCSSKEKMLVYTIS